MLRMIENKKIYCLRNHAEKIIMVESFLRPSEQYNDAYIYIYFNILHVLCSDRIIEKFSIASIANDYD